MSKLTTLIRNLCVGDQLSFDNGRIKLGLEEKSGRAARLRLTLAEEVLVDKPRVPSHDERIINQDSVRQSSKAAGTSAPRPEHCHHRLCNQCGSC